MTILFSLSVSVAAQSPTFQVGDKVTVKVDSAKVMVGQDQVGTLPKGTQFTVEKISGSWLQGSLTIDGQKRAAWVSSQEVAAGPTTTESLPNRAVRVERFPQIELDAWDRPFVFSRRDELIVNPGDTVVAPSRGAHFNLPDGKSLYLTEQDVNRNEGYKLPPGTRVKVNQVDQQYSDSRKYEISIEVGGKQRDGYLWYYDAVKLNRYLAAKGQFDAWNDDIRWKQQNFQRNLPRWDLSHDVPGKMYGQFEIRQGMSHRITFDLSNPKLRDLVGYGTYLTHADDDIDISTRREPGTEKLVASLSAVFPWAELSEKIELALRADTLNGSDQRRAKLDGLRASISNLRAQGKYDEAAEAAAELLKRCRSELAESAWQTKEAEALSNTLEKISKLTGDPLWEITQADASNGTIIRDAQDTLRAFLLAVDQHTVRREHLGADHPDSIAALGWLGYLLRGANGQDVEALHLEVFDRVRRTFGESHPWYLRSLSNLAVVRLDRADHEASERLLSHCVSQILEEGRIVSIDGSLLLANLGRAYERQGKIELAQAAFAKSRAVARALNPDERQKSAALSLAEIALLEHTTSPQFPMLLRSGLAYRPSSVSNFMVPRFMRRYGNWTGGTKLNLNQKSSIDLLSLARVSSSTATKTDPVSELFTASTVASLMGDFGAAERAHREAYRLVTTREDLPEYWQASVRSGLSSILLKTGNVEEAIRFQKEAVDYQRRKWETEHDGIKQKMKLPRSERYGGTTFELYSVSTYLSILGEMLERQGRLDEAERAYKEVLELKALKYRLEDPELWSSPSPRMEELYSKEADDFANLARVQVARGELVSAEKVYRSSLDALFRKWAFQSNTYYAKALAEYSDLLLRKGSLSDAGPMAYDSWASTMRMEDRITNAASMMIGLQPVITYSEYLRKTERLAEAALLLEWGITSIEQQRSRVGGDELNRSQFFSELTRFNPYSQMVRVQVEAGEDYADSFGFGSFGPRKAFDYLETGRGRALLDLTSRRGGDPADLAMEAARKRNDAALKARVETIREQQKQARETLARHSSKQSAPTTPQAMQAQLIEINTARETDRQAARDLFDIARTVMEGSAKKPLTSDEAAERLRKNEALLVYDVGPRDSVLLTVTPDGNVDGHFLVWSDGKPVTQDSLAVSVAEFFEEISRETSEASNSVSQVEVHAPEELTQAILPDKVRKLLSHSQRVFLVADGALHRLPFESLFLDADGEKVLLDEAPSFVYGSSATILLGERDGQPDRPKHGTDLVALGDATFSRADEQPNAGASEAADAPSLGRTRALNRFGQLSPLPGTRAEIQAIISRWPKSSANSSAPRVLLGEEATVGNLMKAVERPRFMHLATHGLAEGGRKAHESALAFAAPKTLSLADNGFLTLADLLERWGEKLSGTEMVVLSACRTARGEMSSGDGFVALTWGFLYAGTRCVVASLWEVDDTATALLMSRLYENVLGSFESPRTASGKTFAPGQPLPKAEALREAKQWLRNLSKSDADKLVQNALGEKAQAPKGDRPFADPYYWAAFVLVGNGD